MSVTASHARAQLFPLIEQVNEDMEAVEIVSRKGTAFLVAAEAYRSLVATSYLLQSPANAEHLRASLAEARAGDVAPHDLLKG